MSVYADAMTVAKSVGRCPPAPARRHGRELALMIARVRLIRPSRSASRCRALWCRRFECAAQILRVADVEFVQTSVELEHASNALLPSLTMRSSAAFGDQPMPRSLSRSLLRRGHRAARDGERVRAARNRATTPLAGSRQPVLAATQCAA